MDCLLCGQGAHTITFTTLFNDLDTKSDDKVSEPPQKPACDIGQLLPNIKITAAQSFSQNDEDAAEWE